MLTIDRITLREIRLALKEPFRISSGVLSDRRIFLLALEDEDGSVGWSESVAFDTPMYSPDTIDTAWLAISEWVAPRVLGRAFEHPRDVFPETFAPFLLGNPAVREVFLAHHADLLDPAFWQGHKQEILAGYVHDVFPYEAQKRFEQHQVVELVAVRDRRPSARSLR